MSSTVEIRERPILFSGPMVRAILEGRKAQTRRVIKPQPNWSGEIKCDWYYPMVIRNSQQEPGSPVFGFSSEDDERPCPYGGPADRLWVRETWANLSDGRIAYKADGEVGGAAYRGVDLPGGVTVYPGGWRPSIHMPRRFSRLTLEITWVRVERLNEISEEDAMAEGLEPRDWIGPAQITLASGAQVYGKAIGVFRELWDSINGKSHPWESNPFVWVVEFRKVQP